MHDSHCSHCLKILFRSDKQYLFHTLCLKSDFRHIYTLCLKSPAPQYPPIERKKRKGKLVEDYMYKRIEQLRPIRKHWLALLLKPASNTPSNAVLAISFQRNTLRGIKVLRYCEILKRAAHKRTDVRVTRYCV